MASQELISLDSPIQDDDELGPNCKLCNSKYENPRVLSCLHVYCEQCLLRNLKKELHSDGFLSCPQCGVATKLTAKGVLGLPMDYIMCNQLDMEAIKDMQMLCTSCKAKESAVARCTECATFLCANCVTAHQYMRCFENHEVVPFEEMKTIGDGFVIHKPVTCPTHPTEIMKYYCHTCHIPTCNECIVVEHKQPEHHYEKAVDAEPKQREELMNLLSEGRSKVKLCQEASTALESYLTDLQMQRDNAKSHIEETFQSYRVILEQYAEELIQELDKVHSTEELKIMETFHIVGSTIDRIDDACRFADRLLTNGNTLEVLSLKQVVGTQLLSLINNTPKPDASFTINFETDEKRFEIAVKESFGKLNKPEPAAKREETPLSQRTSPMHSSSSFESEGFNLPTDVNAPENSLPSLDVDLANNLVAQYNIAQLAGMAERSVSRSSTNTSPQSVSFPDLLIPTSESDVTAATAHMNAIKNLTALAKIGSVSLNNGQTSLSNSLVSGLQMESSSLPHSPVHSPSVSNHALRGITPSPIDGLESLLNGGSICQSPRVGSPLEGSILNGGSLIGRALHSPSIAPPSGSSFSSSSRSSTMKATTMQIRLVDNVCKFGQLGPGKSQFSSPHGFCLGLEEEIIVADTNNHRIQVFDKTGDFRYQFGVAGKEEGQLWYPRKVAIIRSSGKFVVCDRGSERSRMQIFTKTGHFLKKIAIRYIDIVSGLAITNEGNIVAVDSVAPTVFIISEAGDLLHWFDCSEYMVEPSDIAVTGKEYYICDFKGHCVIVFSESGKFVRRIGCENVTNFPNGIDISDAGDVLVGDSHGNRFHIVVFSRQGNLLSEFECPYVKVSRCCGLKITSEGYVVTLAKNNHHVLVLNTLYIL